MASTGPSTVTHALIRLCNLPPYAVVGDTGNYLAGLAQYAHYLPYKAAQEYYDLLWADDPALASQLKSGGYLCNHRIISAELRREYMANGLQLVEQAARYGLALAVRVSSATRP